MGKYASYVKLRYGKVVKRTKAVPQTTNPVWNQIFEFDEISGGEYLKLKCLFEETFADEFIGGATVNLEGMSEGSVREMSVPLEKATSGEIRLLIEAVKEVRFWHKVIRILLIEAHQVFKQFDCKLGTSI